MVRGFDNKPGINSDLIQIDFIPTPEFPNSFIDFPVQKFEFTQTHLGTGEAATLVTIVGALDADINTDNTLQFLVVNDSLSSPLSSFSFQFI